VKSKPRVAILLVLLTPALLNAMQLKPQTLKAWDAYARAARVRMEARARGHGPFLWVDEEPDRLERVRGGEILVEPGNDESPHSVPHGLVHDWMGAVFVAKASLDEVTGVLNDYARYKDFYKPMVVRSRLLEQSADHEKVSLLMTQKAYSIIAAVETDDEVLEVTIDPARVYSLSTSVRVHEIADYGKPSEHALAEDNGPGYVWRTLTITRLEQRDGGVYIEMEMIALSRSIPLAFRWLVQPLAEHLPRNILAVTLRDTRDAVSQAIKQAPLNTQIVNKVDPRR